MFFGFSWEKLVLIAVIAGLLIGPERLPRYAEGLARFTQKAREWMSGARTRMRDEMGSDFDDVDWRKLDPRQYDPRRIIREALLDDPPTATVRAAAAGAAVAATGAGVAATGAAVAATGTEAAASEAVSPDKTPYDTEAT